MKNKKLLKSIAALAMGAAMVATSFSLVACGSKEHTHTFADTWSTSETQHWHAATCEHTDEKSDVGNHVDSNSDGKCDECQYTMTTGGGSQGGGGGSENPTTPPTVENTPTVPEYKGEADGPVAGQREYKFMASEISENELSAAYDDGVVSMPSGTKLRSRDADLPDGTKKYSKSVQNGKITIKVPVDGSALNIYFSSGSGTVGSAQYKLTKPDNTSETVTINTAAKALQTITIEDAEAGNYVFEKANGTVDTYEITLTYQADAAAIESISVTDTGTADYLITQQLDCTGVKAVAVDAKGVSQEIKLENCTFDTSKYDPNKSGEYTIKLTYHLKSNVDSDTKEFTAEYKVKVYEVDSVNLTLIGLASSKPTAVQQAYLPNGTFSKANLSVMATCKFGSDSIVQRLKDDWVSVSTPDLTSEGVKTVTVTVDSKYTVGNKAVSATYEVAVKAKKEVANNKVEVTVGATGDFKTLTQAVQYLKACNYADAVNKVIKLSAGTYTEKVLIDVNNVTLVGTGTNIDDTVVTYSLVEGDRDDLTSSVWALNCASVHVTGKNFKAYHLAIRNDFDYMTNSGNYSGSQAAQGVALTIDNSDTAVVYDCHLYGNQDTLYMKSGRCYYYKTQIDGNIDFIFGGEKSIAYFEECKIVAINREKGASDNPQNGYVTAPQHKSGTKPKYGYVFYKCELTDDGKVNTGSMSLGRPWGEKATVAYIECSFSDAYSKLGTDSGKKISRWNDWNTSTTAANADYCEYGSTDAEGNPIMSEAVQGGKVLTEAQAQEYTKANVFGAANTTSYTTAWDCDAALAQLKTLLGLN